MYNIMSCSGFDSTMMGTCSIAWFGLALLFFVVVFSQRWLGEDVTGMNYDGLFGFIGAYGSYLVVITLSGSPKWALLAGLLGSLIGGLGLGALRGGSYGGY